MASLIFETADAFADLQIRKRFQSHTCSQFYSGWRAFNHICTYQVPVRRRVIRLATLVRQVAQAELLDLVERVGPGLARDLSDDPIKDGRKGRGCGSVIEALRFIGGEQRAHIRQEVGPLQL